MARFTFVDLFAGIGGMRLGLEGAGGRCVMASEISAHSRMTYRANFGEEPLGDIRRIRAGDVPDHDVLAAGFPCQPFSAAGVSKRRSMGVPDGLADGDQGRLFFEILRIVRKKRPPALLLENVRGLAFHAGGSTLGGMLGALRGLGYATRHAVVGSSALVPQRRERLFVAAFHGAADFGFPDLGGPGPALGGILSQGVAPRYTLADGTWAALRRHASRSRRRGSGFGHTVADPRGPSRTLCARYHKDGAEILVAQGGGKNPRRLTPRECVLLMGFPAGFRLPVSDTRAYMQLGNAAVPPVVARIAAAMAAALWPRGRGARAGAPAAGHGGHPGAWAHSGGRLLGHPPRLA